MNGRSSMKRVMIVIACLALCAAALMVMLAAAKRDSSLAELQRQGVIRIGYAVEAPYAFLSPGGEVTGESPEIAKWVVSRLGIPRIIWRQVEFGALVAELRARHIDVIASGMFITPERAQEVSFSIPTFHVRQGMLVAKGNPKNVHSYAQAVRIKDIRIAVLSGSVEESLLRHLGLPERQLVRAPDALTGRVAVESGVADALALSTPTVRWMMLENRLGATEMAQPFEPSSDDAAGYGAFAFRKEDRRLRKAWNGVLGALVGSREQAALIAPFGFTTAELPDAAQAAKEPAR